MPVVVVPVARVERWVANFVDRHGETRFDVAGGALHGEAADGSTFAARPPMGERYVGEADATSFARAVDPPAEWGVLLVRKGGFAVARLAGDTITDSKVGRRHVQGRTAAGGQSQQRFARRRVNQARQSYEAAADHAARVLGGGALPLVTGGDRAGVDEVLADPRLGRLVVVGPWLDVPDPRRDVLDRAVADACSVSIEVHNA